MRPSAKARRTAFNLVELLIVIAIIGLLMQLILPAVQSSREASRRTQCMNNLHQFSVASLQHESTHGALPSGGWGYLWVGDPDYGVGPDQPGGWLYHILPYLEQSQIHAIGRGLDGDAARKAATELCRNTISAAICPSRRANQLYPYLEHGDPIKNCDNPGLAAKCDYAGSAGDLFTTTHGGPQEYDEKDSYHWEKVAFSGVIYERSWLTTAKITDGLSNTYLLGEKYMSPSHYEDGDTAGDDQTMYVGHDQDTCRWTKNKAGAILPPRLDDASDPHVDSFGSAHPSGCNFAMCDGSIETISYDVDELVHVHLSNRFDEQLVNQSMTE